MVHNSDSNGAGYNFLFLSPRDLCKPTQEHANHTVYHRIWDESQAEVNTV
jgi:hypothetical protein